MKTSDHDILNELLLSKNKGSAVGIRTKDLDKLFITAVDEIVNLPENNKVIILKPSSIYGDRTPKTELNLNEIVGVVGFKIRYGDPFYTHLREIKESIRKIKTSINKMNYLNYYVR